VKTATVAVARDSFEAELWTDALRAAGIPAASYERGAGAALGGAVMMAGHVVVAPAERLGEARSIIAELADASVLAPLDDTARADRRRRAALWTVALVTVGILALAVLVIGRE
jgi:hypothetical protein